MTLFQYTIAVLLLLGLSANGASPLQAKHNDSHDCMVQQQQRFLRVSRTLVGPCDPDPCKNGDCTEDGDGYKCDCHGNWAGGDCDKCKDGFTGPDCEDEETEESPCDPNPCKNGDCTEDGDSYKCDCRGNWAGDKCDKCKDGYTGDDCETPVAQQSPCEPNPCGENGDCSEEGGSYKCECHNNWDGDKCDKCKPGWTGDDCNTRESPCEPNPCGENGDCVEEGDGHKCNCHGNFDGDKCDECKPGFTDPETGCTTPDESPCEPNPCGENGDCVEEGDGYKCNCHGNFDGDKCDECKPGFADPETDCKTPVSPCEPDPCVNSENGCVLVGANDYTCDPCKEGWKGKNCDVNDNPVQCDPNLCKNGQCKDDGQGGSACVCDGNWDGVNCDECKPGWLCANCDCQDPCFGDNDPCQNGGTCQRNGNLFERCDCPVGWKGTFCEIKDSPSDNSRPCDSKPCVNGDCRNEGNDFKCDCFDGWEGRRCRTRVQDQAPTTRPPLLTTAPPVTGPVTTAPPVTGPTTSAPVNTNFAFRCPTEKAKWTSCLAFEYESQVAQSCDVCVERAMATAYASMATCRDFESAALRATADCGCSFCSDDIIPYARCASFCGNGNGGRSDTSAAATTGAQVVALVLVSPLFLA